MVQREHGIVTLLIRPHCSSPQADADLAERATRENFAQHMTRFLLERSFSGRRMHDPNLKRIIGSCQASCAPLRNQYRVPRRAFDSGNSRPTEKKRRSGAQCLPPRRADT
jgi:hypothetical protein